MQSVNLICPYM